MHSIRNRKRNKEQENEIFSSAEFGDCSGKPVTSLLPFYSFRGVGSFQHQCCGRVCRRTINPWTEVPILIKVDMSGNNMLEN